MISGFGANIAALVRPQQGAAAAERTMAQSGAGNTNTRDAVASKAQSKDRARAINMVRGRQKANGDTANGLQAPQKTKKA